MAPSQQRLEKKKEQRKRRNERLKRDARIERGTDMTPQAYQEKLLAERQAKMSKRIDWAAGLNSVPVDVNLENLRTHHPDAYTHITKIGSVPLKSQDLFSNRAIWFNELHAGYTCNTRNPICGMNYFRQRVHVALDGVDSLSKLQRLYLHAIREAKSDQGATTFSAREAFLWDWQNTGEDILVTTRNAMRRAEEFTLKQIYGGMDTVTLLERAGGGEGKSKRYSGGMADDAMEIDGLAAGEAGRVLEGGKSGKGKSSRYTGVNVETIEELTSVVAGLNLDDLEDDEEENTRYSGGGSDEETEKTGALRDDWVVKVWLRLNGAIAMKALLWVDGQLSDEAKGLGDVELEIMQEFAQNKVYKAALARQKERMGQA
ncbi:uncharacterized protein LTR77_006695 [Saxophila tyrrhenica]|uniref:Uncharacterized protein n=1 Tax=Saxophila tyrrhenica TaxID=1690608 RepID=A0AAV9P5K3_9PEZI|nr:hypothetical protein LTR77_006695 [Saxophila tyrrhenica]